jgi:prepilin-type processing-associated H-X9-DG protein/prepilin-type N-terminal cleavage/methylation domain-containing protein
LAVDWEDEISYRCYMTRLSRHEASAFTLLELLVTIAVIVVLVALVFPGGSRSKARAQQVQCMSNLRQLGIGLQMFVSNSRGYPSEFQSTNPDYPGNWVWQLEHGGLNISDPETNFYLHGVWLCPSAQWHVPIPPTSISCYGYNAFGVLQVGNLTNTPGLLGHRVPGLGFTSITEAEVAVPSDMMAIGDSFTAAIDLMRSPLAGLLRYGNTLTRHNGQANVVFCDSHVEPPKLEFLFDETNDLALSRWNRDHQPHRELLTP